MVLKLSDIKGDVLPLEFGTDEFGYEHTRCVQKLPLSLEGVRDRINELASKEDFAISRSKIFEAVIALASGRHLILYGPPGTGKTRLANELARIFRVKAMDVTASAEWTSYDTVGGIRVRSLHGRQEFVPYDGIITSAVLDCCRTIVANEIDGSANAQATWLIIDELNRANMDKAFGAFFSSLDPERADNHIELPHWADSPSNKILYIPRRFRIIGTMNSYDKNFLFQMSYALTRRFAFVYVGVPRNGDELEKEDRAVRYQVFRSFLAHFPGKYSDDSTGFAQFTETTAGIFSLIKRQVHLIRGIVPDAENPGLNREIGTAQFLDAFRYAVLAYELRSVSSTESQQELTVQAVDEAIALNLIPQLEGLSRDQLQSYQRIIRNDYVKSADSLQRYIESSI